MVADGAKIEQSKLTAKGITPNRTLASGKAGNEPERPVLLKQRGHFDPRDIEFALLRLAKLLAITSILVIRAFMPVLAVHRALIIVSSLKY